MGNLSMYACLAPLSVLALSAQAWSASLRYAEDQGPGIVHPAYATTMSEARLNELVFEALVTDDRDLATTGQLASHWEVASDGLSMVVHLRPGASWHDGTPVTAEDIVFTVDALKSEASLSPEAGRVSWIDRVEAQGPATAVIHFHGPEAQPADRLRFRVLPRHRFSGPVLSRTDDFRRAPVGSGPYAVDQFNADGSITLSRASDSAPPSIDEIVLREISDRSYQAKMLLYESLEVLVRVLPRDLAMLEAEPGVSLYPYQTNSWWYVGFDQTEPPFDDPRVRQAVSQMVDVDKLLAPIGTGATITGPYVPSSPFYNHDVPPWEPDPAGAAALLEAAGWSRSADGWSRNGELLRFTLTAHRSQESAQEVVVNLQSQLRRQGVEVEVEFLDSAAWRGRVWRERRFDAVLSQWTFDRSEDIREQFHSEGTRNFLGYRSAEVDRLLDEAASVQDPQARKAALREVHRTLHEEAPMIFLWTLDSYSAVRDAVQGVAIHPFYFFTWVRDWRMP